MSSYVSPTAVKLAPPAESALDLLTKRQREVLKLLGEGHSRAEIAQRLFRSPKTVDNHCTRIYEKLGVHSQASLIRMLHEHGLLSSDAEPNPASDHDDQPPVNALSIIESCVQSAPNDDYFNAFLVGLCRATGMEIGGICEVDREASKFFAIAAIDNEKSIGQVTGCFDACQCTHTFDQGQHIIPRDLAAQCDSPTTLSRLNAVSYAGVLLEDRFVGKVGTLWVASRDAIEQPAIVMSTLRAIRRRAATELALQLAIDKLDELGIAICS